MSALDTHERAAAMSFSILGCTYVIDCAYYVAAAWALIAAAVYRTSYAGVRD